MLINLPIVWIITLNVCGWILLQWGMAWGFTRLPGALFGSPSLWPWERGGRLYERLAGVRFWKHRLPDGASWFVGGFAKRQLASGHDAEYLRRFARETRRGELCHLAVILCTPLFLLWNPLWAMPIHAAYALVANLPCLVVQRYNRGRMLRALQRNSIDR